MLSKLSETQYSTNWVQCLIALNYFEMNEYNQSAIYFEQVHRREPTRFAYMDKYSTVLWHLQREVALSALSEKLLNYDKNSPITWCVAGNCFSLHKEHDIAIKFLRRAVQVDPNFTYGYTLLGKHKKKFKLYVKKKNMSNQVLRVRTLKFLNIWKKNFELKCD